MFIFLLFSLGYGPMDVFILPLIDRKTNWFCMIFVVSLLGIFVERSHESW
jgi:hypothetical protein